MTGAAPVASQRKLVSTIAWRTRSQTAYALEGGVFVAGAIVQWLRDGLGIIDSADQTEGLARETAGNDGVYFVPAFVGLGAPHWQPDARGMITGLTRGTTRAHIARAALEAMAYATADVLRAMEQDAGVTAEALAVDGGASANNWLLQFQSDIVQLPVRRPRIIETTALGAAGLAGIAAGVWSGMDEFMASREDPETFEPRATAAERDALVRGWRKAIDAALHWAAADAS